MSKNFIFTLIRSVLKSGWRFSTEIIFLTVVKLNNLKKSKDSLKYIACQELTHAVLSFQIFIL